MQAYRYDAMLEEYVAKCMEQPGYPSAEEIMDFRHEYCRDRGLRMTIEQKVQFGFDVHDKISRIRSSGYGLEGK